MGNNKVLISGVAGLIGSHFSRYLLDKGYEVYGIDNLSGSYKDYIDPRVIFHKIDLRREKELKKVFKEIKPDYVYHFAAYAAEGLSPFVRRFNYTSNLLCSVNVINECIKNEVKKIIFTSSMAVYGENQVPFTEDMRPNPADPYGIAKYAVEMDLKQAQEQFGLRYSIVRPHNVIGIYQNIWDKYRNVVGIWIRRALNKESILIFGDGEQKRAFSDINYCLEPLEKLMTLGDREVFNLGSDKEYTLNETADILGGIANEFGYMPIIEYAEQRHEVKNAYSSHDKAKDALGFKDETDLRCVMKDMFEWALMQPHRETKQVKYEINKGMYSYWK